MCSKRRDPNCNIFSVATQRLPLCVPSLPALGTVIREVCIFYGFLCAPTTPGNKCFPLGALHYDRLNLEQQFVECFLQDLYISYSDYLDMIESVYTNVKGNNLCDHYSDVYDVFSNFYNSVAVCYVV